MAKLFWGKVAQLKIHMILFRTTPPEGGREGGGREGGREGGERGVYMYMNCP